MFISCENPIRIQNPDYLRYLPNSQPFYEVPCGQCILCRLKMRKEWTLRLRLEASLYEENCFVTLTYDNKHVPPEVQVRDIQLFVKRLRKNSKLKFRFYSVSEYGSHTQRPHFHIILFGFPLSFKDYVEKGWTLGFVKVSPLTQQRCNYTCGYTQKKYDKRSDKSLFSLFPQLTYQERLNLYLNCSDILEKEYKKNLDPRRAEFATCSKGIGEGFLTKNLDKIKQEFCIHFGGKKYSIPRYFRKKITEEDPGWVEEWKNHMEEFAKERMVGLFDKASVDFVDYPIEIDDMVLSPSYEGYVEKVFRKSVELRADTIKKKRELYKNMRKNKEI